MYRNIRKITLSVPLMLVVLCLVTFSTVAAQEAATATPDDSTQPTSGSSKGRHTAENPAETTTPETEAEAKDATSHTENETDLHTKGMHKVAELRKQAKTEQSAEQRVKKCDTRKNGLQTRFTSIAANAQRYQDRIDATYAKALTYQKTLTDTPANFDTLVTAADSAKVASALSVSMLKNATPSIDCTKPDVATTVATFKAAADDARTNLKAYKAAVKAVIHSLLSAKENATSTAPQTTETRSN